MTRRGKIIALGLVLLVGVPVSLPFVWRYQGKRELRRTLESLKTRGEKLTAAELAPPRPPDADNGYRDLLAAASLLPSVSLPIAPFVAPGRRVVTTSLVTWTNHSAQTADTWEDVAAWRESTRDALEQARVGLAKPAFHAGRDYSRGFNLLLPDLSQCKRLAQSFALAAMHEAKANHRQEALENLRAGLRISMVMQDDPIMISQLVRIACDMITFDTVWHCLHTVDWTEAELAEMQAMLPPRDHMAGMVRALEMERAMGRSVADWMRRSDGNLLTLTSMGSTPGGPTNMTEFLDMAVKQPGELFLQRPVGEFWRFAHLDGSEAHYLNALQLLLDNSRLAAERRSLADLDPDISSRMLSTMTAGEKFRFLLSSLMLPAIEKATAKALRAETQRSLTEAAIALHRFKKLNGRWPQVLSDLVPRHLAAVPIDYSDGKPLRYRLQEDGSFVLYSIGEWRVNSRAESGSVPIAGATWFDPDPAVPPPRRDPPFDEGGDPTPYQADQKVFNMWNGRDVVWPQPATKDEIEAYEARQRKKDAVEP